MVTFWSKQSSRYCLSEQVRKPVWARSPALALQHRRGRWVKIRFKSLALSSLGPNISELLTVTESV